MKRAASTRTQERFVFVPPPPEPLPNRCEYADGLLAVCEPMLEKVRKAPSEVAANVALLQLQVQYWLRYEMTPKAHRDHIGSRNGHNCIFQVYRYYFLQLRDLLLAVNPPPLRTEARPLPPQIQGIFLGEDGGGV